ncbi:hypothetical protein PspLS_06294 [Pyricularia sp. CBS 133598]|nr:hypothetical protein PspLS_06294 [Pyricularia sp. CBS 133598]
MILELPGLNPSLLPVHNHNSNPAYSPETSQTTPLDRGSGHRAVALSSPSPHWHAHAAKSAFGEDNPYPKSSKSTSSEPPWLDLAYPLLQSSKQQGLPQPQLPTATTSDQGSVLLPELLEATLRVSPKSHDVPQTSRADSAESGAYTLGTQCNIWGTATLWNTPQPSPVPDTPTGATFSSPGTTTPPAPAGEASTPSSSTAALVALERCRPLLTAVLSNNLEMARLLVRAGAKLEVPGGAAGLTPLHRVVDVGSVDATRALLDLGANVLTTDSRRRGLLHTAVARGHAEVVEAVLEWCERRGDGNLSLCLDAQDDQGITPLYLAVKLGREDILNILLRYGADVNIGCESK